jgi:hypothetical protein
MRCEPVFCLLISSALFGLVASAAARADDSAAAVAVGGLVARRETRIVMAKEVLFISPKNVVVDYDFRNDTDQDVTTEVAFPIPPYTEGPNSFPSKQLSFADFRVQVDGKPLAVKAEAKAFLNGKEITRILAADKIDIQSFGNHDWNKNTIRDLDRLPQAERKRLESLGIFEAGLPMGNWTVHLQYHWTQTFPARSTIHIMHEYTPFVGFQPIQLESFKQVLTTCKKPEPKPLSASQVQDDKNLLVSFCPDIPFLHAAIQRIEKDAPSSGYYEFPQWVDFILSSANTWKRPIEDFTLIVERGEPDTLVSLCSPGKVEKLDANHFQVHLKDFVPSSELHIGFFTMPEAMPVQPATKN